MFSCDIQNVVFFNMYAHAISMPKREGKKNRFTTRLCRVFYRCENVWRPHRLCAIFRKAAFESKFLFCTEVDLRNNPCVANRDVCGHYIYIYIFVSIFIYYVFTHMIVDIHVQAVSVKLVRVILLYLPTSIFAFRFCLNIDILDF